MDIKDIVKQVITKYSDGYPDPFRIAKNMNYIILKENLDTTNGYYYNYNRNKIIGINYNLNEIEQLRVCAHEIGHSILHEDAHYLFLCKKAFFSMSKYEKEADIFAIHLLLSKFDEDEISTFTTEDIANITSYPLKYVNRIFFN